MDVWKIVILYSVNCMFLGANLASLAYYYGGAFSCKSRILTYIMWSAVIASSAAIYHISSYITGN